MIVSKPKPNALMALGVFIILTFSFGFYALNAIIGGYGVWYHYVIAVFSFSFGSLLLIRQLLSYKIVTVGENKIHAKYPFRGKNKTYAMNEVISWREEIIKTKNAPYRQLEVKFNRFLLKLTVQENTKYEEILKYLKKRAAKKETK